MARKRDRSKRKNYRKGSRVNYAHGGRPSRRDYGSGDEYQVALEQWRSDPAHQGKSKAPVKPVVSTPVTPPTYAPVTTPSPPRTTLGPDNLKDKRRKGRPDRPTGVKAAITPPTYSSVTAPSTRPATADDFTKYGTAPSAPIFKLPIYDRKNPTSVEISDPQAYNAPAKNKEEQALKDAVREKVAKVGSLTNKDLKEILDNISIKNVLVDTPVEIFNKGVDFLKSIGIKNSAKQLVTIVTGDKPSDRYTVEKDDAKAKEIAEIWNKELQERRKAEAGSTGSTGAVGGLQTMPTKFSGVGPGTQFDKEGAGDDPPVDPDAPVGSLGVAGDKAAAAAAVGYSVGSGMGARGDAWRSEDGGNYADTTYGENPDGVPQSLDAARKWENKRRELEGLDTDVDGNPLPIGNKHYQEAQRAMNNLGRQPNAEETTNWLYENYPEAYKASLREQGIDTTNYVHTPFDVNTNPLPVQDPPVDIDTGDDDDDDGGTGGGTGASGDNLSRQRAMDIIAGVEGSEGPQIGAPQNVGYQRDEKGELIIGPDGNPLPAGITPNTGIEKIGELDSAAVGTITEPTVMTTEDATVTSATAQQPITAAGYGADQVGTDALIVGQQGAIGDESLAKAAKVERVAPIQAATVEIPEGALAERVVGTLSPNAIAIAAKAAGTTLSKVTRAKKQLRNAGMSEEAITALGNDPEDLEDRLMDLTEAERGVIGNLPEEALVSNQIDSLLKGMESGEIPTWASPAVAAVEQMLAQRGLSASTVGRDNLFNAIIQSALPIAQSNAQAIQQSVAQSLDIESREELFNAQARQQTALQNAGNVFQMDMAQFSADQQTTLSNSKFMQTVSLTEASNRQQAAVQNATITAQLNLADADFYQKGQIQNAQAFLGMDMANLSNKQQATVLSAQINQQSMLSNQAATNASSQFNATSENQTQQFMAGLAQQIEITNAAAATGVSQFNAQQENAAQATRFQVEADLNKAKAAMETDINKINAQLEFSRKQWNATNAQAVEQSNVAWRRQGNTLNTAAANQVAMQNAMNAFNLNGQSLAFLWQELRDNAAFDFQKTENFEDRKAQIYAQTLANDGASAENMSSNIRAIGSILKGFFDNADVTTLGGGS